MHKMIILLKIIIAILCAIVNHCSCVLLHKKLQYWYNANNYLKNVFKYLWNFSTV